MSPKKDQDTTNLHLAQFKNSLHERWISEKHVKQTFQKLDNVNAKIKPTNYFKLHKPHLLGSTVLHLAYNFEHASGLSSVLSKETDFTIKNQDNLTILHLILRYQGTNVFRFENLRTILDNYSINLILSAHLDTRNSANPCDDNGMSHFHIACMTNNIEAINFFLDNGVLIDHAINFDSPYFAGFTALHLAIRCCNLQVFRVLLIRGANIYLKNAKGETASHMVMENYLKFANDEILGYFGSSDMPKKCTNEEIAKLLLEFIINNNTTIIDDLGLSSLHLACTMMDSSIAAKLAVTENINQSIDIKSPLWPGYTALHFAAHVNTKTVQILVKKGADLLAKDAHGMTPIDLCIKMHKTELDIHAILSMNQAYKEITLTQKIKLTNLIFAMKNSDDFTTFLDSHSNSTRVSVPTNSLLWPGLTPLHLTVLFSTLVNCYDDEDIYVSSSVNPKYLHFVSELHNRNSNLIVSQDVRGRTPLHLAFQLGKTKIVKSLIELHEKIDFPVDLVDDENLSLLHIACSTGEFWRKDSDGDVLAEKLLLRSKNVGLAYEGKPIGNLVETGWTPLHVAVASGSVNCVEMLLKYGADVHVQDVHGVTPIHLLFLRNESAAKLLLDMTNLRECVVEDVGLSHLHVACYVGNADAVKKLLDDRSDVNLRIIRDRKVIDKSFQFSKLIFHSGHTPLQAFSDYCDRFSFDLDFRVIRKKSRTIELLVQHGADIFVLSSMGMPYMLDHFKDFYMYLKENADIQRQAEEKIGLTKVHVACFFKDWEWLKNLVNKGVDVNGKLSMDFPKCGGFTPLHVLMETRHGVYGKETAPEDEFIKLLLDAGADVTVTNAKLQTPLHMLYRHCTFTYSNDTKTLATAMLKAQKDFTINPINAKGISHFHIACNLCETSIVKKFLERCDLDVNQSIDYFAISHKFSVAGFTPLHVAIVRDKSCVSMTSQLETVDLLLKHGADPNRQDSCGKTALHLVHHYEIFERFSRQGVDLNVENLCGSTPLDSLFSIASADQIGQWLRLGRCFNLFSAVTGKGCIGNTFGSMPFKELQNLLKVTIINIPDALQVDDMGRTAIHNIVSCEDRGSYYPSDDDSEITIIQYTSLIELLATTGCDVDTQDNLGRTALHFAVQFKNSKAISALLMAGADINILDNDGRTAFAYHTQPCDLWGHCCDEDKSRWCDVFKALAFHVRRLQVCKLEVCPALKTRISDKCVSTMDDELFHSQLREIKNMKIKPYQLALGDFLSETNAVHNYPTMSQLKKDAIDEFFFQETMNSFREKFGEVAGLLSLQYRKAVIRTPLIKEAVTSLNFFAEFEVPQICSRIIFGFLSNTDLKNFIASTENCKRDGGGYKINAPEGFLLGNKKIRNG